MMMTDGRREASRLSSQCFRDNWTKEEAKKASQLANKARKNRKAKLTNIEIALAEEYNIPSVLCTTLMMKKSTKNQQNLFDYIVTVVIQICGEVILSGETTIQHKGKCTQLARFHATEQQIQHITQTWGGVVVLEDSTNNNITVPVVDMMKNTRFKILKDHIRPHLQLDILLKSNTPEFQTAFDSHTKMLLTQFNKKKTPDIRPLYIPVARRSSSPAVPPTMIDADDGNATMTTLDSDDNNTNDFNINININNTTDQTTTSRSNNNNNIQTTERIAELENFLKSKQDELDKQREEFELRIQQLEDELAKKDIQHAQQLEEIIRNQQPNQQEQQQRITAIMPTTTKRPITLLVTGNGLFPQGKLHSKKLRANYSFQTQDGIEKVYGGTCLAKQLRDIGNTIEITLNIMSPRDVFESKSNPNSLFLLHGCLADSDKNRDVLDSDTTDHYFMECNKWFDAQVDPTTEEVVEILAVGLHCSGVNGVALPKILKRIGKAYPKAEISIVDKTSKRKKAQIKYFREQAKLDNDINYIEQDAREFLRDRLIKCSVGGNMITSDDIDDDDGDVVVTTEMLNKSFTYDGKAMKPAPKSDNIALALWNAIVTDNDFTVTRTGTKTRAMTN